MARTGTDTRVSGGTDGLLLARMNGGGVWGALVALRRGMQDLKGSGRMPRLASFAAIAGDGRLVDARDAALFALEYRLDPSL